jgi:D-serine deaminase-like pyridoxal phosphate-dependent protein
MVSRSVGEVSGGTPYVLIDGAKMERNVLKMAEIAMGNGVALRPHVKTHKIPGIAREQLDAGAAGITVAKLSEAEVMADGGIEDVFVAYPLVTDAKIRQAIRLGERVRLVVGVDSLEGAKRLSAVAEGHTLEVRLEVDTGLRRTGVLYDEAVGLAGVIEAMGNLDLIGIYTYRGAVLGGSKTLELEKAGLEEGQLMVSLADMLRERGIRVDDVSVGSTPTAEYVAKVEGVTEIRPGTYVFYDRMQACSGPGHHRRREQDLRHRCSPRRGATEPGGVRPRCRIPRRSAGEAHGGARDALCG